MSDKIDPGKIPYDLEAEKALLGSFLLDDEQFRLIEIKPTDFFSDIHRMIYSAMKSAGAVDIITVARTLHTEGKLTEIGGAAYLQHLLAGVPTSLHAEFYAKIVKDAALNRKIISIGSQITQIGLEAKDPLIGLEHAQGLIQSVGETPEQSKLVSPKEVARSTFARYAELRFRETAIKTGIRCLDSYTGGIYRGDYVLLGAPTYAGKTTLALQMARHIATRHNVLWFPLEMMPEATTDKNVAALSGVPVRTIRKGNYDAVGDKIYDKLMGVFNTIENLKIWYSGGYHTTRSVRRSIEFMKSLYSLDIVFIDYLQLLKDHFGENPTERIGFVTKELASMTKEFNLPIVALVQLSRAPGARADKHPLLTDLRDSGELEQSADVVYFLYSEAYYNSQIPKNGSITELIIAKDRLSGGTGTKHLKWNESNETYISMRTMTSGPPQDYTDEGDQGEMSV